VQLQEFDVPEAFHLGGEFEQRAWQWSAMGRIIIELQGAHQYILRIGRFENRHATRLKHPDGFIEHIEQHLEWKMLNDVKTGYTADAAIG
jgi:hypothetical protein